MGGGARKMVLVEEGGFRCRNCRGAIYKLRGFALAYPQRKAPQSDDDSWVRLRSTRLSRMFLNVLKRDQGVIGENG